jgi:hypothetical protein
MSITLLEKAATAGASACGPEEALRALLSPLHTTLGERSVGAEDQFFVAGAFLVSPDEDWHMLVGNIGFPAEQTRLMIPISGGHPGSVFASKAALHLPDTRAVAGSFKQYLKTARMGSAMYVPMIWQGRFLGQIVMAAKERNTLGAYDFAVICAAGPIAAALWIADGGDAWLRGIYPPEDGCQVASEGMA